MTAPPEVFCPSRLRTIPAWRARLEIRLRMRSVRRRYGVPLPLTGAGFLAVRRRAGICLGWLCHAYGARYSEAERFESGTALGGGLNVWQEPPEALRPLCGEALR